MKKVFLLAVSCVLSIATSGHAQVNPASSPAPKTPLVAGQTVDCGCEDKPLPEVLALVNGIRISKVDISEETQKRIKDLQQQVIDARQREVDLQINSILLEAEARKRGITTTKLLEEEVVAKVIRPTEADARAFYDANKAQITKEFSSVTNEINDYLIQQRQQEAAKALATRLRAAAVLKLSPEVVTPGLTQAARARLFATVNGRTITSGDVEDSKGFDFQCSGLGLYTAQKSNRVKD